MNKVVEGLKYCLEHGSLGGHDCRGYWSHDDKSDNIERVNDYYKTCPYKDCKTGCVVTLVKSAIKQIEDHELIIDNLNRSDRRAMKRIIDECGTEILLKD